VKSIIWLGALLAVFGILGLAVPIFTTSQTKDVVNVGSVKIENTEQSTHVIPEALSAGVLALGIALIGVGVFKKNR
jgi:hypothetical protein